MKKDYQFPHLSAWVKRSSQLLRLTRDEIVRSSRMCSQKASDVWNGKDIRISYYIKVFKLLFDRSDNPRYKLTRRQMIESLIDALLKELNALSEK